MPKKIIFQTFYNVKFFKTDFVNSPKLGQIRAMKKLKEKPDNGKERDDGPLTLGSLFDGIGVFPLAASRHGIVPRWASEIEKAPISITRRHFPRMEHLGDITKLDGGTIPAVHIITFGSPCQNYAEEIVIPK